MTSAADSATAVAAPPAAEQSIAAQLVLLAELASIDEKAKTKGAKLDVAALPARKLDEQVAALQKRVDDAAAKRLAAELAKKAVEGDILAERTKIRKWEARASELRGEREHAALNSEISGAKKAIRQLEEKQLAHLEAIDAEAKRHGEADGQLTVARAQTKIAWEQAGDELTALKREVEDFKGARQALLAQLPAAIVRRYEQVAGKRQGVGVSIIRNDICSACKRTLPPQLCIQVRKGLVLEACGACSRFLVHESMTAVEAAVAGASA